jgi:hypothetical protein
MQIEIRSIPAKIIKTGNEAQFCNVGNTPASARKRNLFEE